MSAADLLKSGLVQKGFGGNTSSVSSKYKQANTGSKPMEGGLGYAVGDTVRHIKFGNGTVLSIQDAGRDYEVSVNFQSAGIKKMLASFAKLKKI